MKTPCEKLGYEAGDKFIFSGEPTHFWFPKGEIITLVRDDGSGNPEFTDGHATGFVSLESITPYQPSKGNSTMFSPDMTKAILVRFKKRIFEDDFAEPGMLAWLTQIDPNTGTPECYKLHFDFAEFEQYNRKYFIEAYYSNKHTEKLEEEGVLPRKTLYTALEAGMYSPKYSVLFDKTDGVDADMQNLTKYIEPLREDDDTPFTQKEQ